MRGHKSIRVGVRLGEYDTTKEIDCLGNNCADPVLYMGVEEKIPHERYNERSKDRENDIGLVRMNGDVGFTDYIKPICLPTTVNSQRSFPNEKLMSAGWGRTLASKWPNEKQFVFFFFLVDDDDYVWMVSGNQTNLN